MFEQIIGPLKHWAEHIILTLGYPGIGLLMFLDSLNVPIPSEVIMPFGGILAGEGKLNFFWVGFAGSVGTVIGSCCNYAIGYYLGKDFLLKYGKFILLRKKEIEMGDRWFHKYGTKVTLWGRFIPLVRTFISLPAGVYKVHFPTFLLYAILGATPWCYGWAWVGFKMGENWAVVEQNWKVVDYIVVTILLALIIKFLYHRFKKDPGNKAPNSPA